MASSDTSPIVDDRRGDPGAASHDAVRLDRAARAATELQQRIRLDVIRAVAYVALIFVAAKMPLLRATLQGVLLADAMCWVVSTVRDVAYRRSLSWAEGIGYLALFWLFAAISGSAMLPAEPVELGLLFLAWTSATVIRFKWWAETELVD